MSNFSFKSSGKKAATPSLEVPVTLSPVGIKTPLQLSDNNIFSMHYNVADQVHDNLRNLLLTNWGERLGFYFFGANLRELTTELTNIDAFEDEAIARIRTAVSTWMPFVTLKEFSSSVDNSNNLNTGIIRITVTYSVSQLNVENRSLQISLYVI